MVPIVRTGLVNRMTTYLFSLKVLKVLLLVVAKGVNSVQVFHRKFSSRVCMWISHFSSVLIQQGWIRSTLSDYRSSFVCEICMLSTPLANNSREQSFGSQDYNDRNDQILIYLGIHNLYTGAFSSIAGTSIWNEDPPSTHPSIHPSTQHTSHLLTPSTVQEHCWVLWSLRYPDS